MKKRCLYAFNITAMILSLAACGKAVSTNDPVSDAEEIHRAFVNEDQTEETESGDMVFPENDKINVGFCQASNYHEWQVAQTESFYSAFMENDCYKLFIADAHGDGAKQAEQLEEFIKASVDVIFIIPIDMQNISEKLARAEASGIQVFILDSSEEKAVSGTDARNLLED